MVHKLAFIGFGTVGQGLLEILEEKRLHLRETYSFEYAVVAVSDTLKGSVCDRGGLDGAELLRRVKSEGTLAGYPGGVKGWDPLRTIAESGASVVLEATYTDIKTGEPALSHLRAAIDRGQHVVTTNKGPLALAYRELDERARRAGVEFRFEGTVLSGTPSMSLGLRALAGCAVSRFQGILNGTTNYILTEMEAGKSYAAALARAQELGYAEAVPDADVEGFDAQAKVVILANVLMGADLRPEDVRREGITGLAPADVEAARGAGCRWKLIGRAERRADGTIEAAVGPVRLPLADPLAGVGGATNALTLTTDLLGPVTIIGAGAGRRETGCAMLTDLLDIHRLRG